MGKVYWQRPKPYKQGSLSCSQVNFFGVWKGPGVQKTDFKNRGLLLLLLLPICLAVSFNDQGSTERPDSWMDQGTAIP